MRINQKQSELFRTYNPNESEFFSKSFGLKFIPNQSEIVRIISEFVSEPNRFIPI